MLILIFGVLLSFNFIVSFSFLWGGVWTGNSDMRNSLTASVTKGTVEIDHLVEELAKYRGRARMLIGSFSAASNLTGVMEQVDAITTLLHNNDALALWDYAAAGPHTEIDMNPGSSNGTFFIFPFSFYLSFFWGGDLHSAGL